jgi:hypothetical protein
VEIVAEKSGFRLSKSVTWGSTLDKTPGAIEGEYVRHDFLVPEAPGVMQRLESMHRHFKMYDHARDPQDEYKFVYETFRCSKQIARTPEAVAFVKSRYCDRLMSLGPRLTAAHRRYLADWDPVSCTDDRSIAEPIRLEIAEEYCGRR